VIGYYAHHRGAGHIHRAVAIAARLQEPVTILSSAPPPAGYSGPWVTLPLDHGAHDADPVSDATAHGALHWAPLRSPGLSARTAAISAWIAGALPDAFVVDVSVEVALLARLHGVPVITMAQPGDRSDEPHTLGYRASSAIVAAWPPSAQPVTTAADVAPRVETIGTLSRLPLNRTPPERIPNSIAVLGGFGDRGASRLAALVADARAALPGAHWIVLRGAGEHEVAHALRTSSLVMAHCGQNALAEIAASRIPAIMVPEDRPHDEQHAMARALAASTAPVAVLHDAPEDWTRLVAATSALDGEGWAEWSDGGAVDRAVRIIRRVASAGADRTANDRTANDRTENDSAPNRSATDHSTIDNSAMDDSEGAA
jgi:hypothetical protein